MSADAATGPVPPRWLEDELREIGYANLQLWIEKGEFHEALRYLESGDGLSLKIPDWACRPGWIVRACSRSSGRCGVVVVATRADGLQQIQECDGPARYAADDPRSILNFMLRRNVERMRQLDATRSAYAR